MMNTWTLVRNGAPAAAFEWRQHAFPTIAPGKVRIACEGFGLNYADAMAAAGLYRETPPLPCIIGYEAVGRVVECGSGVPAQWMGKRVLALTRFGGYGEQVVVDAVGVVAIADDLPLGEALALGTQGATAWYMATYAFPLMAGQRVLVHSAAGGVGQLLVQMAVQRGCEVAAVVGSAAKAAHVLKQGARHIMDRSKGDYAQQARDLMGTSRFDVSFNPVGGRTFKQDMTLIGSGGAVVLFGGAARSGKSGGMLATLKFVWDMGLLLPIGLMMRSKSVIGVNMLKLGDHRPDLMGRCLREAMEACARGELRPHVHGEVRAAEMPGALAELSAGRTMGKVAVRW